MVGSRPTVTRGGVSAHVGRLAPWLLLAAWGLLLVAWVVGNPPFAAPDETDHYIRAVGISEGHLIGIADPGARVGATPRQIHWTAQAARIVMLPAGLDPTEYGCDLGPGLRSAACQNTADPHPPATSLVTTVGNYQPFPYLLPAAVLRAGDSPASALRLARLAVVLMTFALLAIALFALYDASAPLPSLLGLVLVVTPMVLFCGASLNGSATEIAGALAFFACLMRLARPGRPARRWWVLTALSGATLALSRSVSPFWLVLALLVALAWSGARPFAARWGREWGGRAAAAFLLVAVAVNRIWEALYGSHTLVDLSQLHAGLVAGAHEWWTALPDLVGKFGYLDVKLPLVVPVAWLALIGALIAAAAAVSGRRDRILLAVVLLAALVGPVVFYAVVLRPIDFGLQGRHVLPIVVALPLLAGEALYRRRDRADPRRLARFAVVALLAVAVMQPIAWYVNARIYAVGGAGPTWFLAHPAWSPPGGWWPWLITAVLGGSCLAAISLSAAADLRGRREAAVPA
jgi:hypothetical protein